MTLDMGVGFSSQADISAAGQEAGEQVVSHLAGRMPDVVLVFSSIRFADPRMLKAVRAATGMAPLVGCTDAGGIVTSGPKRRSVTAIGLVSEEGTFRTHVERGMSHHPRESGEALADHLLRNATETPRCLLSFPDSLTASGSEVLAGMEKRAGSKLALAGATAADDLYFQKTFQFHNDEVLSDSVPGVLLCGRISVGIGIRHGWSPVGRPRRVTRASGSVIYQLDGRPAVSIFEEFLGLRREELMQEPLASVTLTYPLGTEVRGHSEYLLRDAIRVGKSGSLVCMGNIPEGSDVRLMIGGYESALEAAQQSACDAVERLGGERLKGALVFCSVARQKMLGSEFQGEIDVIRDSLGGAGVRIGGFYTYGEMAPTRPIRGGKALPFFHNESVVVVALG